VINVFFEINLWRQPGGFGPAALTFMELDGYCKHYKVVLSLWELQTIKKIDQLYLKWSAENK